MSWFFSVALPVDPSGCQEAVGTLRSVARTARSASDVLDGQSGIPTGAFGGLAAETYRLACGRLSRATAGLADDATGLAAALEEYVVRVVAARSTLLDVREAAVAGGFRLADDIVQWVPAPASPLGELYGRLERRAARAHDEIADATAAWRRARDEFTTGRLAPPAPSATEGAR